MKRQRIITILAALLVVLNIHAQYQLGTITLDNFGSDLKAEALINLDGRHVILGNGQNACIPQYTIGDLTIPGIVNINGVECTVDINQLAFRLCNSLTKVTVTEGVTTIGDFAFVGCSMLWRIELPSTLNAVGSGAFVNLPLLKDVISHAAKAPRWEYNDVFAVKGTAYETGIGANRRTLYVPRLSGKNYRESKYNNEVGWGDAFGRISESLAPSRELNISTIEELYKIQNHVNSGSDNYADYTIRLTADLVFDGDSRDNWYKWTPIGTPEHPFMGVFDGQGHTIKNFRSFDKGIADHQGLFGYVEFADIGNLRLENISMKGGDNVGTLVGVASNSLLHDIIVQEATSNGGEKYYNAEAVNGSAGGLAGRLEDTKVDNCYIFGKVKGATATGGIAGTGQKQVDINDCATAYALEGTVATGAVGGILGTTGATTTVSHSYSRCTLDGAAATKGAIVGVFTATDAEHPNSIAHCAYLAESATMPVANTSGEGSYSSDDNRRCSNLGAMKGQQLQDVLGKETWYYFHEDLNDYPVPLTLAEHYKSKALLRDKDGFIYAPGSTGVVVRYNIIGYDGDKTDITLPLTYDYHPVLTVSARAFAGSNITSVTIPDGVYYINEEAFAGCESLKKVHIGKDVESDYKGWFDGCLNLSTITVSDANRNYWVKNGTLYDIRLTKLIRCGTGYKGTITVPASVTEIATGAFANCKNLVWVDLRATTTKWNVNRLLKNSPFYEASKYTLFVMNGTSTVVAGEPNVVYDDEVQGKSFCQQLLISDDLQFLSPIAFHAKKAIYERPLTAVIGYETDEQTGEIKNALHPQAYTVCLPFVPKIAVGKGVKVYMLDRVSKVGDNTYIYFDEAGVTSNNFYRMHTNYPYLVVVSGDDTYTLSTNEETRVEIVSNDNGGTSTKGAYQYIGTTTGKSRVQIYDSDKPAYMLKPDGNWYMVSENMQNAEVPPFQCYVQSDGTVDAPTILLTAFSDEERTCPTIQLTDLADNSQVLAEYHGKQVNVQYNRTLSATQNADGTWSSKAYTVCLPYDLNLLQSWADNKVDICKFHSINEANELCFSEETWNQGRLLAGHAYLVVVNQGTVTLNANDVKLFSQPYAGDDVYLTDNEENGRDVKVGKWLGIFNDQTNEWAVSHHAYGLSSRGTWERYSDTEERYRQAYPRGFRALFCTNEDTGVDSYSSVKIATGGPVIWGDSPIGSYDGDYYISTGIINVKNADGTHRYFDLQGRQLPERPAKGMYIENGQKIIKTKQ